MADRASVPAPSSTTQSATHPAADPPGGAEGPGGPGGPTPTPDARPQAVHDPVDRLRDLIRDVPDFPKPGVVFRDFTPLLADPAGLALAVELMANPFRGRGVELVVGAESRGFIFGTAIAQSLSAGFVPIRKQGKLPHSTDGVDYELEYGRDRLEIHADALRRGQRVLLVDDLVATGGTLDACGQLLERAGGTLLGISVLIELTALRGRDSLERFGELRSVIRY